MVKSLVLLARRQGLHVEGIIGVLGGRAESLVKAIVPLASSPLVLALHPNLTVGLCHLVFSQLIVHDFMGILLPLRFSPHLRIQAPSSIQDRILLSSSDIEFVIDLVLARLVGGDVRAPAELLSQEQGSDDDTIDEEDPIQQVAEFGIKQAEALRSCVKR